MRNVAIYLREDEEFEHTRLSQRGADKQDIYTVIRTQCEQAAHNDTVERNRISPDLYDKQKKVERLMM